MKVSKVIEICVDWRRIKTDIGRYNRAKIAHQRSEEWS